MPADRDLDVKRLAAVADAKRAALATRREAERATGYVLGGISPLGQRRRLPTYLDESAFAFPTVYVSGGRRGLEIELSPAGLRDLCAAQTASLAVRAKGGE